MFLSYEVHLPYQNTLSVLRPLQKWLQSLERRNESNNFESTFKMFHNLFLHFTVAALPLDNKLGELYLRARSANANCARVILLKLLPQEQDKPNFNSKHWLGNLLVQNIVWRRGPRFSKHDKSAKVKRGPKFLVPFDFACLILWFELKWWHTSKRHPFCNFDNYRASQKKLSFRMFQQDISKH